MPALADAKSAIGYRCKNCWQEVYAPVESAGKEVPCAHCETPCEVPQPTASNLCSYELLEAQDATEHEPELTDLSPDEIYKLASEQARLPLSEMEFSGYPNASLLSRFIAAMIDSAYGVVLVCAGLLALALAMNMGVLEASTFLELLETMSAETLIIFYFPLLLGHILQWNLIATRGQSIGKLVCCIRIITMNGKVPGFLNGVMLRYWLFYLLGGIPFLALIDVCFIFTGPQRCLHDYAAGTRVVTA